MTTHEIEGIVNNRLKLRYLEGKSEKSERNNCSIIPFAQDDMVATFMQGIDPSINNILRVYLNHTFERLPELIDDDILAGSGKQKKAAKRKFEKDAKKLLAEFRQRFSIFTKVNQVDPILNMVYVLPKDELGIMAETLVNLTAFKRRMTHSLETVGGPVDVAIISKGDGFAWVKRKHYFPSELNQHFFANYFECTNDEK